MGSVIENNLAKNIVNLRKELKLKQSDLGKEIGYSDKTISKWENGSSVPDINAISSLADFFNVSVDDMLHENAILKQNDAVIKNRKNDLINKITVALLIITLIWMTATIIFVYNQSFKTVRRNFWQVFIWAIPVSFAFIHTYNRRVFKKRIISFISLSLFVWTGLLSLYLQFIEKNFWLLFILGIPAQLVIIFLTLISTTKTKT